MERRKIQQYGYTCLSISLPKEWTTRWGLKKGAMVTIVPESDGSLRLVPEGEPTTLPTGSEVSFPCPCDQPGLLSRLLASSYMVGHETIIVDSHECLEPTFRWDIRRELPRLLGLTILDESPERMVFKCSLDASRFRMDTLLNRLAMVISLMLKEAASSWASDEASLPQDLMERGGEVELTYRLMMRVLHTAQRDRKLSERIGLPYPGNAISTALALEHLKRFSDDVGELGAKLVQLRRLAGGGAKDLVEEVSALCEDVYNIFQNAAESYVSGEPRLAGATEKLERVFYGRQRQLIRKRLAGEQEPEMREILSEVLMLLERMMVCSSRLAAVALMKAQGSSSQSPCARSDPGIEAITPGRGPAAS